MPAWRIGHETNTIKMALNKGLQLLLIFSQLKVE